MKTLQEISDDLRDAPKSASLPSTMLRALNYLVDYLIEKELESYPAQLDEVKEVLAPNEVAALLNVHLKTVYKLAEAGKIPGVRIGRSWRFSRAELMKIVQKRVED